MYRCQNLTKPNNCHCTHLESLGVGTGELVDLVATLEGNESGHLCESSDGSAAISTIQTLWRMTYRLDAHIRADFLLLVDVDLVEINARELRGELLEDGRDDTARTTPGRPEVNDDGLVTVDLFGKVNEYRTVWYRNEILYAYDLLEVSEGVDGSDRHCGVYEI